jgi:PIN domain nuclease of toxin-antitoxin system
MKFLLDTHIWIWMMDEPKRLAPRVQQQLQSQANELWLSPVSTWEVLLLHGKRRIQLQSDASTWVKRATEDFREAPLTHEIVVVSQELALTHPDPADKFIAATAKVLSLTLITADSRLLSLPDITTLSNR